MAKRRFYSMEITVFRHAKNAFPIWFQHGKATDSPDFEKRCSSHKICYTIKQARQIGRGIIDRWPDAEVVLLRYWYHSDRRKCKEYYMKKEQK